MPSRALISSEEILILSNKFIHKNREKIIFKKQRHKLTNVLKNISTWNNHLHKIVENQNNNFNEEYNNSELRVCKFTQV